jgi:hypothetical protein
MNNVAIVICYEPGTKKIFKVCASSIHRHTFINLDCDIVVVVRDSAKSFDITDEIDLLEDKFNVVVKIVNVERQKVSSRTHGLMLDQVVPSLDCKYVLTLDSDCFPVADNWLQNMVSMFTDNVGCVGVLFPYAPPPSTLKINSLEFRVRGQHCWNNTHVACQMVPKTLIDRLNLKYADGDDTGLLIPAKIREAGYWIRGFKAKRCPKPDSDNVDAEFNRTACIIYADTIYHHGHYTREILDYDMNVERTVEWARKEVMEQNGAEFLLSDEHSYCFKYDREEEVGKRKMDALFGMRNASPY